MKKSKFIYASIILASINFIVRLIGFIYKILLSKLIGAEGIGFYQMVMPVLMIFLTITTAGIPIAVSKLVSKESSLKNYFKVKKIYRTSVVITFLISLSLSIILLILSKYIAYNLLKNSNIYYLILALSPAIIIISLSSVIRGYYYGLKRVKSAGIALVLEQITRIIFVLGFLYYAGSSNNKLGPLIAVIGISVGEIFGLLWLIINNRIYHNKKRSNQYDNSSIISILVQMSYIALPITLSRMINVVLQLANAVLIPQRLVTAGLSSGEAIATYGRVIGMTLPFVFLPFIVTSALVINIIPNLSEQLELKRYADIKRDINLAIRITLLISIPVTGVYLFFSKPLSIFIYNDIVVGEYMVVMGASTVFLSLQHTLSGILQGLGKQVQSTINYVIGMSFQLFCTYYLVGDSDFKIYGFFIGFFISTMIICMLNYKTLIHVIRVKISFINAFIKPIFATLLMLIVILFLYDYIRSLINIRYIYLSLSLFVGIIVYFIILILTNGIPMYAFGKIIKRKK